MWLAGWFASVDGPVAATAAAWGEESGTEVAPNVSVKAEKAWRRERDRVGESRRCVQPYSKKLLYRILPRRAAKERSS